MYKGLGHKLESATDHLAEGWCAGFCEAGASAQEWFPEGGTVTLERRGHVPDSRSGQEGHDRTLKRGLGKGEAWPLGCVAQGESESRNMSMCVGCGVCM